MACTSAALAGRTRSRWHGRDNRYHLFDPNYFHIALKDKATFKSYVTWYLSQANYDTSYTKRTGVVGIRPP